MEQMTLDTFNFENLEELPTFDALVQVAYSLVCQHATTQAYEHARRPSENNLNPPPIGSAWTRRRVENDDVEISDGDLESEAGDEKASNDENEHITPLDWPSTTQTGADITLANATLFIRNGIWWRYRACLGGFEDLDFHVCWKWKPFLYAISA